MRFKIDENLPAEVAGLLQAVGHDAQTVYDEGMVGESDPRIIDVCQREHRILITLDVDFADIRTYPPEDYSGIMVLRLQRHDKQRVIEAVRRTLPLLAQEPIEGKLWIVEETRVRVRGL